MLERNLCCLVAGSARSPVRENVGTTSGGPVPGLRGFPTGGRGAQIENLSIGENVAKTTPPLHLVVDRRVNHNPLRYPPLKFF